MNFPKGNPLLSLYNIVLNKIKSLKYPEEILYKNYLGSKLCQAMIQQFRNTNHLLLKPYRYKHTEFFSIQDLTNNLLINRKELKTLKELCFDVMYKKNMNVFDTFKEIPKIIKKDIKKVLENRNRIYDVCEENSALTLQKRKFVDKDHIFPESSNYFTILRKIYRRKYVNINRFDTNDNFKLLKISEQLTLKFKCKIKKTFLGLELNSNDIRHFVNLEKYIKSIYYPDLKESIYRFKSLKEDKILVNYNRNDIESISGYKFLKDNCFQDDEYYVSLNIYIKEKFNEISLYFKIDEIIEIN